MVKKMTLASPELFSIVNFDMDVHASLYEDADASVKC